MRFWAALVLLVVLVSAWPAQASAEHGVARIDDLDALSDIGGTWMLQWGDDPTWADPQLDDSQWLDVKVPKGLGNQGFRDRAGFVWYRVHLMLPVMRRDVFADAHLALRFPRIDSAAEIFVNGMSLGTMGALDDVSPIDMERPKSWVIPSSVLRSDSASGLPSARMVVVSAAAGKWLARAVGRRLPRSRIASAVATRSSRPSVTCPSAATAPAVPPASRCRV